MNTFIYQKEKEFIDDAVQTIEDFVTFKLDNQDSLSIALSGGQTPIPIYQKLVKNGRIKWEKVDLFMVDERYVPADDKRSNFKLICDHILSKIPPIKSFESFNTNLPIDEAADTYDDMLEKREQKGFDLVILGMGADGHTASLFPKTDAINEKVKLATTSQSPDGLQRLTITLPTIFRSEKVIFFVGEKGKKEMLAKLLDPTSPEKDFPAKMVSKHKHVDLFILNS